MADGVGWRNGENTRHRDLFSGTRVTHLRAVPTFYLRYFFLFCSLLTLYTYILAMKG